MELTARGPGNPNFAGAATQKVVLPGGGAFKGFTIQGQGKSGAVNDTFIEAHLKDKKGAKVGEEDLTVFHFDQQKVNVAPVGKYAIVGGSFRAVPFPAVNMTGSVRTRPAGTNCAAPEVKRVQTGIVQNVTASNRQLIWSMPAIKWAPGVPKGRVVSVPATLTKTVNFPAGAVLDSGKVGGPLYDLAAVAPACPGGAVAATNDTPGMPVPPLRLTLTTPGGAPVATIDYQVQAKMNDSFITYTTVHDKVTNKVCSQKSQGWSLNVDSKVPGKGAVAGAVGGPGAPVVGGITANALGAKLFNKAKFVPTGMKKFVR